MQTTIKQQIKAVQKVYNDRSCYSVWDDKVMKKRKAIDLALNDAASTLAAVAMMEDQIQALPKLLKACENICKFYHKENTWPIQELNTLLKQLK